MYALRDATLQTDGEKILATLNILFFPFMFIADLMFWRRILKWLKWKI